MNTETKLELSQGFSAGDYCCSYETNNLNDALFVLNKCDDYSDAYKVAFTLGFFASYELYEIPRGDREYFDEAYHSEYGKAVVAAGYTDSREEDYKTESNTGDHPSQT